MFILSCRFVNKPLLLSTIAVLLLAFAPASAPKLMGMNSSSSAQADVPTKPAQGRTEDYKQEQYGLMGQIRQMARRDADSTLLLIDDLLDLTAAHEDTTGAMMAYMYGATMLQAREHYRHSLTLLDEAMEWFERPPLDTLGKFYAIMLTGQANAYGLLGEVDSALTVYRQALRHFGEIDHHFRSEAYHNIAVMFEERQAYDSAVHYLQKRVDYGRRHDAPGHIAVGLGSIARIYELTNREAEALSLYEEALSHRGHKAIHKSDAINYLASVCTLRRRLGRDSAAQYCYETMALAGELGEPESKSIAALALARHFEVEAWPDSAGYYYRMAWELNREIPIVQSYVAQATGLADHLLREGRPGEAYNVLLQALERHDRQPQIEQSNLNELYLTLARTEYATGRVDSAEAHYKKGMDLLQASYDRRTTEQLAEASTKFELDQADNALRVERAERQVAAARAAEQRNVLLVALGAGALLLLIGLLAYRRVSRSRAELTLAVEERETLLKEIHHRVKNNLQIISSLLYRQARASISEDVKATLRDGQDRIQAMALVHQSLYQRDNLAHINARDFVTGLVEQLRQSYSERVTVDVHLEMADVELEMEQAIPLGLILNELVTNAFKYAFEGKNNGKLEICFREIDPKEHYELVVKDNGRGLPEEFDHLSENSLGLNLVAGLTRQIGGAWSLRNAASGGAVARVSFAA